MKRIFLIGILAIVGCGPSVNHDKGYNQALDDMRTGDIPDASRSSDPEYQGGYNRAVKDIQNGVSRNELQRYNQQQAKEINQMLKSKKN